jgi:hypothetical protein
MAKGGSTQELDFALEAALKEGPSLPQYDGWARMAFWSDGPFFPGLFRRRLPIRLELFVLGSSAAF